MRRGAPWTVEGTEQLSGRCSGYGRAGSVPIAEPSRVAAPQAPAPQRGGRRPAGRLRGRGCRGCPMLAVPFAACPRPVSGRPVSGVRASGVRCAGVRCPGVRVRASRVRVRLSAQAGFVERVGAAGQPYGWTGDLGVVASRVHERPARLPESGWRGRSWRRPSGSTGGVGREPGRRLRMDEFGHRLQPRSTTWPTRTAGGREGRPSVGWTITVGERGAGDLRLCAAWLRACRQGQDCRHEARP
jgi:hypothetical protein